MGLWRIAGDNLVEEINYLNLSLTGILKLNFVACFFMLREKFENMPSLPKQQRI